MRERKFSHSSDFSKGAPKVSKTPLMSLESIILVSGVFALGTYAVYTRYGDTIDQYIHYGKDYIMNKTYS